MTTRSLSTAFSRAALSTSKTSSLRPILNINTNKMLSLQSKNSVRKYSVIEDESAAPVIDFTKMTDIVKKNDPNYVIVDVREPDEYNAGHIPNAINIPCKSSPGALGLYPDEFKLTFGFDKPPTDKTLVFYCLAGIRSRMSEELAGTFGYEHRLNYSGSFSDWMSNKGEIETPKTEESKTEEPKAEDPKA